MNEAQVIEYIRKYWGAEHLPLEWREIDYKAVLKRVVADFTEGASTGRRFVRIAGQSGSGKTSQILPAVEEYFKLREASPVLVAARRFVPYHPFYKEILAEYGEENIRENTNDFSVILMFLTLRELISRGYDLILDVTLLDPMFEGALMNMLTAEGYENLMMMSAVSKEISDGFISQREVSSRRVVAKHTSEEFWRATKEALKFYEQFYGDLRVVLWSAFDLQPVYDGEISGASAVLGKYWGVREMPEGAPSEEELRRAKVEWVRGI
jgi:hypothetical protein